ncbi:MAG TPA: glycoside hydrolase family 2 protein [Anaerolineae bacterium]|nr:glycoside hydrolase family 2 protein [Anaerolineae bacterium]
MTQLDLNGTWKLQDFDPGQGVPTGAHRLGFEDSDWLPAQVPGDVHTALAQAGRIELPFYHMNVEKCQWVEHREWWYRTTFSLPAGEAALAEAGERWLLQFDGLDTFATVYLNGVEIGQHRNMFIGVEFDITDQLRTDAPNVLAIRFDPVVETIGERELPGQWAGSGQERAWVRKAQYNFSWDWAPRLVSVGPWQGVRLQRFVQARLRSVFFHTHLISDDRSQAEVAVEAEVERWEDADLSVEVQLSRGEQQIVASTGVYGDGRASLAMRVPDPALWWTHDLGEPALYDLTVTLRTGDQVLDQRREWVGIRTIRVDQSPDPDEVGATFFTFVLNGVPIFARGADWIPADSFVAQVDEARYRDLLALAVEANMNMLRVWGGGIYEKPAFYRLCDELGILIWQDFMFSCALYPDFDPEFYVEVEREAEAVVRRLRNHPSLALWCGNNENDWIDDMVFWNQPGRDFPGKRIYHELLPRIVAELDGTRLYWPSSPYGGNDHNDAAVGDRHNWQTWHGAIYPRRFGQRPERDFSPQGVSFRHYAEDLGRFISEFGMHAAPVLETLRRNVPADQLYFGSEGLLYRNKDNPKDKGNQLMLAHTGLPTSLEQYIDFSMIAQAEGLKFGIEHYRRRKFHCSGTLFWQLNDCWPGLSWSVLDYYRFPKAGYFYAKRAYAPRMASFKAEPDGGYSLWIVNDTLAEFEDHVTWGVRGFDGRVIHEERLTVRVPANTVWKVCIVPAGVIGGADPRRSYLYVFSGAGMFPDNRSFLVEVKDLERPEPKVSYRLTPLEGGTLEFRASSDQFVYFVKLVVPVEGTRFDDNYFDLFPGREKRVRIWNVAGRELTPEGVAVSWLS